MGVGGSGVSKKIFFRPFGPQFGLKITGKGGGVPGPLPWIRHTFKLGKFPNFKVHFAAVSISNRARVFICARVCYFDTF